MRILFIDEEFPYPLNTGKRIRSANLALQVARHHEVSYLAYGDPRSSAVEYFARNSISPLVVRSSPGPSSGPRFYVDLLVNLGSSNPYMVTKHYSRAFANELNELLTAGTFDLVVCEWTPYAIFLQAREEVRKVLVAHNIEHKIWQRYLETEANLAKRAYIAHQEKKLEAFERRCFRWFDGATAVSNNDAEVLSSFGLPYHVAVIENGVDTEYFVPREIAETPASLVFTGAMDWRPNQDAAVFLVEEILPLIRRRRPDVTVALVGRRPPPHVRALANVPGVEVTGTVDDVRPYIAAAETYIVPLRIGSGSRLKILEAMAMRKAVVSTSVGAEGLEVRDGESIVLGDTPETFADAVLRVLSAGDLRGKIAEGGYRLVAGRYRWSSIGERLCGYLSEVASG